MSSITMSNAASDQILLYNSINLNGTCTGGGGTTTGGSVGNLIQGYDEYIVGIDRLEDKEITEDAN